jgi:hypothetical protein
MAIGDVYEVSTNGHFQNQLIVNTFYYRTIDQTGMDIDMPLVINNAWTELFMPKIQAACNLGYYIDFIGVSRLLPIPRQAQVNFLADWGGSRMGNVMPSEVAAVVNRKSTTAGPGGRGRIYLVGSQIDDMDPVSGLWNAAYRDLLQPIADAMVAHLVVEFQAEFEPVLWNARALTTKQIVSGGVNTAPRSQRRRQIGRGR